MAVDTKAISLAGGVSWALGVLLLGLGSMFVPSWQVAVDWLANFYIGYGASVIGSLLGALYGFFDVFIGLYVFFWLYNYFRENPPF